MFVLKRISNLLHKHFLWLCLGLLYHSVTKLETKGIFWRQSDHGQHVNLLYRSVFLQLCRIACSSSCPWQTRARPRKAFAQIPPLVASLILDWVQNSTLCYCSRDSSGPAYLFGLLSINLPAVCVLQTLVSWLFHASNSTSMESVL